VQFKQGISGDIWWVSLRRVFLGALVMPVPWLDAEDTSPSLLDSVAPSSLDSTASSSPDSPELVDSFLEELSYPMAEDVLGRKRWPAYGGEQCLGGPL
jgi:hypothetical protein